MGMDTVAIARIENSFEVVASRGEEFIDRFYARLFTVRPEIRSSFPENLAPQKKMLLATLWFIIRNLRSPQSLRDALIELGKRHAGYGAEPAHYAMLRDAYIEVMADTMGDQWNDELTVAWREAFSFVSETMLEGHSLTTSVSAA